MALYRSYSRYSVVKSPSYSQLSSSKPSTYLSFPLGRSTSMVFSRNYSPATPSYNSSPYFTDRYPYVRYSHGYESDARAANSISALPSVSRSHYTSSYGLQRQYGTDSSRFSTSYSVPPSSRLTETLRSSTTNLYHSPYSYSTPERPRSISRDGGHMTLDSAIGLYKNRCLTSTALSKYWLSSQTSHMDSARRQYGTGYGRMSRYDDYTTKYGTSNHYGGRPAIYSRYSRY